MRVGRFLLLPIFIVFLLLPIAAQQTPTTTQVPQRDSQATTFLQAAVRAMGGSAPQDSIALGSITLVERSLTASGTIRILTRGTDQTSVQLQTNAQSSSLTYSNGQASRTDANTATALPLERAASSQSVYFPLPFLSGLLSNPDIALQYIGPETLNGTAVQHIQATNTFGSSPSLQFLSLFTTKDIWLDAALRWSVPSACKCGDRREADYAGAGEIGRGYKTSSKQNKTSRTLSNPTRLTRKSTAS